jgi:hypothetical protein
MARPHRCAIPFVLALASVVPIGAASAQSVPLPALARLAARIDGLSDRLEAVADRQVRVTLLLVRRLDARGASDDDLRSVIADAKANLNFQALVARGNLSRIDQAALGVIDRLESFDAQRPAATSTDFDGARRRLASLVVDEVIEIGEVVDDAEARLDAASPPVTPPEETPF